MFTLKSILLRHCSSLGNLTKKCLATTSLAQTQAFLKLEQLPHRQVIKVSGNESSQFLQGLLTNDMNHLTRGNNSIYTLFLNKGGRVLYDSIVYKTHSDDLFYLECDGALADQLVKHLKLYRIRRKIDVEKVDTKKVWVLFNDDIHMKSNVILLPKQQMEGDISCIDPRLKNLGTRLILDNGKDESYIKQLFPSLVDKLEPSNENDHRTHRYRLGIGEGHTDLPYTKCFPLESNADFLHGVNFNKGCYVGQELTARTHHTGVVRKRLMPLNFINELPQLIDAHVVEILNESGQSVGKLKGYCNKYGLALLRIDPALDAKNLYANGVECQTYKPSWWPLDIEKQKVR